MAMTITPMEIHDKVFPIVKNGYSAEAVDEFLDQIIDDYADVLDRNVDLKNENYKLKKQIRDASSDNTQIRQHMVEVQEQSRQIVNQARVTAQQIIDDAKDKSDSMLADTQKQLVQQQNMLEQYNTLMNDYELLKTEVANFIHDTKAKLNEQVKELDDKDWQIYLDKHYGRTRLYPADGSQPIKTDDSDNLIDEEGLIKPEDIDKYQEYIPAENFDEDIDNNTDTEVNSNNEKEDTHKILEGDNPTVVETVEDENSNSDSLSRPKIIFPDDYKDHN